MCHIQLVSVGRAAFQTPPVYIDEVQSDNNTDCLQTDVSQHTRLSGPVAHNHPSSSNVVRDSLTDIA